jgi:hypothetical protein
MKINKLQSYPLYVLFWSKIIMNYFLCLYFLVVAARLLVKLVKLVEFDLAVLFLSLVEVISPFGVLLLVVDFILLCCNFRVFLLHLNSDELIQTHDPR